MSNNNELNKLVEVANEQCDDIDQLLGKDYQKVYNAARQALNRTLQTNLDAVDAARTSIELAEQKKKEAENNPRNELTPELQAEMERMKEEEKALNEWIDGLHQELVDLIVEAAPQPSKVVEWERWFVEKYFPKRMLEIEQERAKAIADFPGFGEPPKFSLKLDEVKKEIEKMKAENVELTKELDQKKCEYERLLKIQEEQKEAELKTAEYEAILVVLKQDEADLDREIALMTMELERLQQDETKSAAPAESQPLQVDSDSDADDDDNIVVDISVLFKHPKDFPALTSFFNKAHGTAVEKTPPRQNANRASTSTAVSRSAEKKRKNQEKTPNKRNSKRIATTRESLPRSTKSPKQTLNNVQRQKSAEPMEIDSASVPTPAVTRSPAVTFSPSVVPAPAVTRSPVVVAAPAVTFSPAITPAPAPIVAQSTPIVVPATPVTKNTTSAQQENDSISNTSADDLFNTSDDSANPMNTSNVSGISSINEEVDGNFSFNLDGEHGGVGAENSSFDFNFGAQNNSNGGGGGGDFAFDFDGTQNNSGGGGGFFGF